MTFDDGWVAQQSGGYMHNDLHIHDNAIVHCSHVGMRLLLGMTREEDQLSGSKSGIENAIF